MSQEGEEEEEGENKVHHGLSCGRQKLREFQHKRTEQGGGYVIEKLLRNVVGLILKCTCYYHLKALVMGL